MQMSLNDPFGIACNTFSAVQHLSFFACLSVCLSVCWLAGWLPVCLAGWLAAWLAVWLAGCLSAWLSVWLPVCLPVCVSVCLFEVWGSSSQGLGFRVWGSGCRHKLRQNLLRSLFFQPKIVYSNPGSQQ